VSGAAVTVDGRPAGTTPLLAPLALEPGEHEVRLAKAGHASARGKVTVSAGRTGTLELRLLPLGTVRALRLGGYSGIGAGSAAALAGAALLVAMKLQYDAFREKLTSEPGVYYDEVLAQEESLGRLWSAGLSALIAGAGVALGGGLALAVSHRAAADEDK